MALINCSECGERISDKAAACPRCGAPLTAAAAAGKAVDKRSKQIPRWVAWLVLGLVLLVLIKACDGSESPPSASAPSQPRPPRSFSEMDALLMCQHALKRVSRDPEKAEVPYVSNHGDAKEAYFAWGASTKMARMRNGLGLEVATSASCTVSMSEKRITSLTLNGKSII